MHKEWRMYILHFVARIVALFSRLGQASNLKFFIVTPLGFAAHSVIAPYLCVLRTSTAINATTTQTQRRLNAC